MSPSASSVVLGISLLVTAVVCARVHYRTKDGIDNYTTGRERTFNLPNARNAQNWFTDMFKDSSFNSPIMYEISTRPFLYEMSQKYGRPGMKLRDVPMDEFQKLRDVGVSMIWMMGVWQIGYYGLCRASDESLRKSYGQFLPDYQNADIIGSPYQILDYL
jgi:hypothetical protein